jgi:hypothetical protein
VELLVDFIHHNTLLLGTDYIKSWSFILEWPSVQIDYSSEILLKWLTTIRYHLPDSKIGLSWPYVNNEANTPPINLLHHVDFIGLSLIPNIHNDLLSTPEYKPQENNEVIHKQIKISSPF